MADTGRRFAIQGPGAFSSEDKAHFCGRDREISDLYNLAAAYREVLVYGPSAVGKSSVVGAGLVPELLRTRTRVIQTRVARTGARHVPGPSAVQVLLLSDSGLPPLVCPSGPTATTAPMVLWPLGSDQDR